MWLVRHARPLIAPRVCYGATNLLADAQATRDSARALAAVLPVGLPVYSSVLQRCEQLSQSLKGLRPDLSLIPDARLMEMDFGSWEGVRWNDINKAAIDEWTADFFYFRFGGKESVFELMQRVRQALQTTRQTHTEAVWITHAGVIRAVNLLAQGQFELTSAMQWPKEVTDFGQWQTLEVIQT
jgi:alpha-ribazole phosphatase